jgi:hypothetical protein
MAPRCWLLALALPAIFAACERTHDVNDAAAPSRTEDAAATRRDASAEDSGARDAAAADAAFDAALDARIDDDEDAGGEPAPPMRSCEEQIDRALDGIPDELSCAGLYADMERKILADGVRPFAPAVPLWSDGSGKMRWIWLPEGTTIDASDPDEWQFPVGTKFFKEFRANGRRIETRMYEKLRADRWGRATFAWNREQNAAKRSFGADLEDVKLFGVPYHIPSGRECDQCHEGRRDRILGFSAVSLGLPGATGITLEDLVDEGLLDPPPARKELSFRDDGTGYAAQALGWLHINCGVTCHNENQNAEAYSAGMRLKLFSHDLDGRRRPKDFEMMKTTVKVPAKTQRFGSAVRIDPGSPATSLVYQLLSSRSAEREQMPPIATGVVDFENTKLIEDWIRALD